MNSGFAVGPRKTAKNFDPITGRRTFQPHMDFSPAVTSLSKENHVAVAVCAVN
jgi:hypothetical protein